MKSGILITFEGVDGSGKSTQAKMLLDYLKKNKYPVTFLREPGGTVISEKIRKILLDRKNQQMHIRTELLLYLAARSEVVDKVIQPALKRAEIVIADRYYDSTYAYQIFGRGLSDRLVRSANRFAADNIVPDLTFVVDLTINAAQKRLLKTKDRLESASKAFHNRVRQGFLTLAKNEPTRIKLLKGQQSKSEIFTEVEYLTLRLLTRRKFEPLN